MKVKYSELWRRNSWSNTEFFKSAVFADTALSMSPTDRLAHFVIKIRDREFAVHAVAEIFRSQRA